MATQQTFSPEQIKANRIKLLMLWLVPVGLMAIAALVYALVQSGQISIGSKNHGELIQPPIQLGKLAPTTDKEADSELSELWAGHWTLVVRGGSECVDACAEALYLTRQIHVRLDKNANRAQRVYLSEQPLSAALQQQIQQDHRYLKHALASKEQLAELDAALVAIGPDKAPARFFLVDPQGWAMMAYSDQHEGGLILQDLKHLIKFSRER